jgi:hypothetical protein
MTSLCRKEVGGDGRARDASRPLALLRRLGAQLVRSGGRRPTCLLLRPRPLGNVGSPLVLVHRSYVSSPLCHLVNGSRSNLSTQETAKAADSRLMQIDNPRFTSSP